MQLKTAKNLFALTKMHGHEKLIVDEIPFDAMRKRWEKI